MEEVDKIIIYNLRQIGCELEDDVKSIKQFDTDMIVNATVRCLDVITPGLNLPHSLPPNMASRYKVGQEIAQACIELGYRGDIGYQTFLYFGETDIRKILIFLVERLPKETEKLLREPTRTELLMKQIKCRVKDELSRPWLPLSLHPENKSYRFESVTDSDVMPTQAWRQFWKDNLFSGVIDSKLLYPTIVTLHSRGVLAKHEPHWFVAKKPSIAPRSQVEKFSKESIHARRKPELLPKPKPRKLQQNETRETVDDEESIERAKLAEEIEEIEDGISKLKLKKLELAEETALEKETFEEERKKNAVKAKVVELMPKANESLEKLESLIQLRKDKLVRLEKQWETHRLPLTTRYNELISANSSKENESAMKADLARSLVERRKELETELKSKEHLLNQLQAESERLGKEAHRAAYTRRILEIIGNVDKQKVEIAKVLKDTQDVQKEINTLSGQLDRCFTLADETIFADAKRDETARRAYKLLATLHSDCGQIVAMIQSTGAALREIRDLEDQIEKERSKDVGGNLSRITADLSQMKQENEAMATQLRLQGQKKNQTPSEPS